MTSLSNLLLPELRAELDRTRRHLQNIPDGHLDFKSAEKSMPLLRLTGHTAELAGIIANVLTLPEIDMQSPSDPRKILRMETRDKLLADFEPLAAAALAALESQTDEALMSPFRLLKKGEPHFDGTRYAMYRTMLDHMIHHRAQLGVYLRLLDAPVPSTYGPSADQPA